MNSIDKSMKKYILRVSLLSLPCTSTTAVASGLRKRLTTCIFASSSGSIMKLILICFKTLHLPGSCSGHWTTSTTTRSTGRCWSRRLLPALLWEAPLRLWLPLPCQALAEEGEVNIIVIIIIVIIIIVINIAHAMPNPQTTVIDNINHTRIIAIILSLLLTLMITIANTNNILYRSMNGVHAIIFPHRLIFLFF